MSFTIKNLAVGMTASIRKTITEADILMFAAVSTDVNPVHISEPDGAESPFKSRVEHGMLTASLISAVLGNKLPGEGTIYLNQSLAFRKPVRIGDTVTATVKVEVVDTLTREAHLSTTCTVKDKAVLTGEAVVLVPA